MFGALSRSLLAALCVFMAGAAHGAVIGPLPSHHEAVDERSYPWSAIGKLFNEAGSQCSGVAIARDKVLTAAHCLFSERTQRFTAPGALHFMIGYRAGKPTVEAEIVSYEIATGFDPLRYDQTTDADWAVLTLAHGLPAEIEPLRLSHRAEPSGTKAVLAGYPMDRAFAMTADRDCELRENIDAGRLLLHTCRSMKGYSGGPILVSGGDGREVRVAGIQIASLRSDGAVAMLAVPAQAIWQSAAAQDRKTPAALAGAQCSPEGPVDIWLSDIQGRLDPNRLDLSAALDQAYADPQPSLVAQFAAEPSYRGAVQ